jgi:hypothetical protein
MDKRLRHSIMYRLATASRSRHCPRPRSQAQVRSRRVRDSRCIDYEVGYTAVLATAQIRRVDETGSS